MDKAEWRKNVVKTDKEPFSLKQAMAYQREITRERGYFNLAFLRKMEEEFERYSIIMYTFGLIERTMAPAYKRIYELVSSGKVNAPKLKGLLKAAMETNEKELEKSMSTFEIGLDGKELKIDKENIQESLRLNREVQGKKDFKEKSLPLMRNSRK
ncbi:hypothetical protein LCM00_23675 [Bacillus infantis]|uniref:hypothetical protein n=1 Tax=Bacillus infantis TaxID=324767 RepID=UPI001CD75703|nr:hypothetical protein [Bacillus infantis]MCA1042493.1 hypothetical protein [Bacillus infantis]